MRILTVTLHVTSTDTEYEDRLVLIWSQNVVVLKHQRQSE